jgi:hypothetical protein
MADAETKKATAPLNSAALFPAGIALLAWLLFDTTTSHLNWFESGSLYRMAANILYPLLGVTIVFSGPAVYIVLFAQGVSNIARIFLSLIVPFAWVIKEVLRVTSFFSLGESLYYALSPLALGLLVNQAGILSLCEILLRMHKRKKGTPLRIVTIGPVLGLLLMVVMSYFMFFWGSSSDTPGSKWFYLYMEGYKALFEH